MNAFIRWAKFNLVGAMGMAVQLAALSLLNRWTSGHYLYASAGAVELALLHNFLWHSHYTWRDRRADATRFRQFVRFHFSIGLVSILGNLALTRVLVHGAHLPLLISNMVAIFCCALANFRLGNEWVFGERAGRGTQSGWIGFRTSSRYAAAEARLNPALSIRASENLPVR